MNRIGPGARVRVLPLVHVYPELHGAIATVTQRSSRLNYDWNIITDEVIVPAALSILEAETARKNRLWDACERELELLDEGHERGSWEILEQQVGLYRPLKIPG